MKAFGIRLPLVRVQSEKAEQSIKLRGILGKNLFDAGDWLRYYPSVIPREVLKLAPPFPWPLSILEEPDPFLPERRKRRKKTHFAFLALDTIGNEPLTLVKFESLHPVSAQPRFYSGAEAWYREEPFATQRTCGFRWYLLRIRVVPGSRELAYAEQEELIRQFPDYEIPTGFEEVMKDILFFWKHRFRKYANKEVAARCRDDLNGRRPEIGFHDNDGLCIGSGTSDNKDPNVGIGASYKLLAA